MELLHFTDKKRLDFKRQYTQIEHELKPSGLWYSLGDSWEQYLYSKQEEPPEHIFKIELDYSEVLILSTIDEVKRFNKIFAKPLYEGSDLKLIPWELVKLNYKGIEIRNYKKLKNSSDILLDLSFVWFSSWDVSSGCVWDLSAVKNKCNK